MAAKRLRGWALEKETGAASSKPASQSESALATKLLSLWAHGVLSAVMIRELAHLAVLDGASHKELHALAKAGQFGQNPGNVHKHIVASFCKSLDIESFEVAVPCIDPNSGEEEDTTAAMFLPHMLFWTFATQYASVFDVFFKTGSLEDFWKKVRRQMMTGSSTTP